MIRIAVGTFTDGFMGGTPGQGLYLFELDPVDLAVRHVQTVPGLQSPSYLARHPSLPILYAVERRWSESDAEDGALTTMLIGTAEQQLTMVDRARTGGGSTAHVGISPAGTRAAVANPMGRSIGVFRLDDKGCPTARVCFEFDGVGALPRQSAPWPHSCWFDQTGRRMFVCDLGLDQISIYDVTDGADLARPAQFPRAQVCSGAGPRHLALTPGGRFCYVANELDGTVCGFAIAPDRGALSIIETIALAHSGGRAVCQPAEIVTDRLGHNLYVTVRGCETIAMFAIDPGSGRLTNLGQVRCGGNTPRHMALGADDTLALVCNQLSDQITIFARDSAGILTDTGRSIAVPSPSCAVFLSD